MQMQGLGSELSGSSGKKHDHLNQIVRAPDSQNAHRPGAHGNIHHLQTLDRNAHVKDAV